MISIKLRTYFFHIYNNVLYHFFSSITNLIKQLENLKQIFCNLFNITQVNQNSLAHSGQLSINYKKCYFTEGFIIVYITFIKIF